MKRDPDAMLGVAAIVGFGAVALLVGLQVLAWFSG